jgi:hypothetical protein
MLFKRVSIAVVAVFVAVCAAHAQSANDFRGPAELPPAGFTGQQFVDSRGCVFLKAGLSGRVNWVPRVSRDRRQLCGYPPTFAAQKIDVVENSAPVAPKVPVRVQAAPAMEQAAARPARQDVAAVAPAPAAKTAVAGKRAAGKGAVGKSTARIGCYRDAPFAERFALQGGGTIVLCTRGDGDIDHARPPVLVGGKAAVAASGFVERKASPPAGVPKGYRAAWQDDRLNPHRGKGTAEGQMAQDQIWTRQVPARLVADTPARGQVKTRPVRLSTKSAAETTSAGLYVQVGSFGQPANAEGAAARIAGLGLPVAQARAAKGGLRVVVAGPFGTEGEARAALAAARHAGFADAFIR